MKWSIGRAALAGAALGVGIGFILETQSPYEYETMGNYFGAATLGAVLGSIVGAVVYKGWKAVVLALLIWLALSLAIGLLAGWYLGGGR